MANLILTGLMGAGKTVIGRQVACRLGFRFLDTDNCIENKLGKTIPQIFAEYGEPHFRWLERELVGELMGTQGTVLATGGGMVVEPDNLRRLKALGRMVYLRATPEVLLSRIQNELHRPLLALPHPAQQLRKLRELLALREPYYTQADYVLDTSALSLPAVTEALLNWWEQKNTRE